MPRLFDRLTGQRRSPISRRAPTLGLCMQKMEVAEHFRTPADRPQAPRSRKHGDPQQSRFRNS